MANIPVEKKAGTPWWLWLLGLLLLAGAVYLVVELTDDEPDADEIAGVDDNVGPLDDAELEPGVDEPDEDLTDADGEARFADLVTLFAADTNGTAAADLTEETAAERLRAHVGQRFRLDQAEVTNVVGDSAFYVGEGSMRTLVVLSELGESELGAGGSDGVFDVDEGETVSIDGEVVPYQEGMRGTFGMTDEDRNVARQRGALIAVRRAADVSGI